MCLSVNDEGIEHLSIKWRARRDYHSDPVVAGAGQRLVSFTKRPLSASVFWLIANMFASTLAWVARMRSDRPIARSGVQRGSPAAKAFRGDETEVGRSGTGIRSPAASRRCTLSCRSLPLESNNAILDSVNVSEKSACALPVDEANVSRSSRPFNSTKKSP